MLDKKIDNLIQKYIIWLFLTKKYKINLFYINLSLTEKKLLFYTLNFIFKLIINNKNKRYYILNNKNLILKKNYLKKFKINHFELISSFFIFGII